MTTPAGFTYRIEKGKSATNHTSQYFTWNVPYQDGKLEAVAYDQEGNIIETTTGRSVVETAGVAAKLSATTNYSTINADGDDLSYITVEVTDVDGNLVPDAANSVSVEVTGNGRLLALDNGSQFDHTSYYGTSKAAFNGKMIAIVQSTKTAGTMNVNISASGLEGQSVKITTTAVDQVEESNIDYLYYPKNYYVKVGNAPVLPTQINVVNKDQTVEVVNANWTPVTKEQYDTPNTFVVEGVASNGEKLSVNVTVLDTVQTLLNTSLTTSIGVKPELPSSRPAVLADGTILDVNFDVTWEAIEATSYEQEGTFVVNGTANVFGQTINVTASVRVQEATVSVGSNIAPQALRLTQNIPVADQSDTLEAIRNGAKTIDDNNSGGPNPSAWSNYTWSQKGNKTSEITFEYATQQSITEMGIWFFEDGYSARHPEAGTTKILVSDSGSEGSWTELVTTETIGSTVNRVKEYNYEFEPTLATFVKIVVTNKEETLSGRNTCTGITEVEIRKADMSFTVNDEAAFETFKVGDVVFTQEQLLKDKHTVESLDAAIEYIVKENTAVTELPVYNGVKRFILESEDKAVLRVFELSLADPEAPPEYEENENGVETVEQVTEYEVYPIPQAITYENKVTTLTPEINLVLSEGLDEYTIAKAKAILTNKGLNFTESTTLDAEKTNVVVGIKGRDDEADRYFTRIAPADIFGNIDAHRVSIRNQVISVLGKDSDAAFYGLVTLEHIFDQMVDGRVNNLLVNDYSSQKLRGTIEGFYGVPWSIEDKKDLLEFGGKLKNNVFIFAPKDDPYHRDRWRDLYPQDKLDELAQLAQAGNENKNRFVWTISPFHNQPITATNVNESIEVLKAKFDQLYDIGIRQFGVLGDDVGSLPLNVVVQVMNAMSDWAKTKPEKVYDFVFCPYSYTLTWNWSANELNTYTQGFPEDVHIFFTGRSTCSPVTKADIDEFKTKGSNGITRKDPLFWLNWPVNDIDKTYRRLFMGMGEMLHTDVDNAAGVVTNPMQEAHASMNAIFAVADYTWNTKAFNAERSWKAGLSMIEPSASEALIELATHMASANQVENNNNSGVPGLQESEEMAPIIKAFEDVMNTTATVEITSTGTALKERYQRIIDAVDTFNADAQSEKLKAEMLAYITGLKEKSEAAIKYIDSITAYKTGNKEQGDSLYTEAEVLYNSSRSHRVVIDLAGNTARAESGTKRLNPNIVKMRNHAKLIMDGQDQPELPQIPAEIHGELISRDNENALPLAIASFTNDTIIDAGSTDTVEALNDGIIDYSGARLNRWTNWRNPARSGDWIGIMFGDNVSKQVKIDGIKLGFFEDHGVKIPKSYVVEYYIGETPTIPNKNHNY